MNPSPFLPPIPRKCSLREAPFWLGPDKAEKRAGETQRCGWILSQPSSSAPASTPGCPAPDRNASYTWVLWGCPAQASGMASGQAKDAKIPNIRGVTFLISLPGKKQKDVCIDRVAPETENPLV